MIKQEISPAQSHSLTSSIKDKQSTIKTALRNNTVVNGMVRDEEKRVTIAGFELITEAVDKSAFALQAHSDLKNKPKST